MALDLGTLTAYLGVDTNMFEAGFTKARTAVMGWSSGVPGWMGIGTAAIVAGGIAAVAGLYKVGEAFDEMDDKIRAGTGATGDALEGLKDTARDVATDVPASFGDIGDAITEVHQRLGLTGDPLRRVTGQFLELGRVLEEDIDIDATGGALNAFNIDAEGTEGALDFLFQQSQRTGIGFNDLASRVASAAPITQQLGFTFEETAGMIATMDQAGLDSQTMIGAMQRGLVNLTKPGEDASDAFRRVVGEIEGFMESGDKAAAMDLAKTVFGTRGASQFIGALNSGKINLDDLSSAALLSGDSIMQAGQDTMDAAEKWTLLKNNAATALEPLGSAVFGAVSDALSAMMPGLTAVSQWAADNPAVLQIVAAVLGVLALAFVGVTIATWALNTALLANPITWIIIGIVALIAAIVLLVMNWDAVVAWITEVWGGFIGWITDVIDGFVGWWTGVWDGFASWIGEVWDGFVGWIKDIWQGWIDWIVAVILAYVGFWQGVWNSIASFFTSLWQGLVSFVTGVWEGYMSWLRSVVGALVGWWNSTWAAVGAFFGSLWDGVVSGAKAIWENLMSFLGGIPGKIMGFFSGIGSWLWNAGRDLINGLLKGIQSLAGTIGSFFLNLLPGWIVGPFKAALGIASPSRVFAGFARNTVDGYLNEIARSRPRLAREMAALPWTPDMDIAGASVALNASQDRSGDGVKEWHYHAAENQSLSAEEALFDALGSPRAKEAA